MKQYLKMADVFNGVVLNERSTIYTLKSKGFTRGVEVFVNDVWASFNGHDGAAENAAHAINSHDELVKMNKELLAALEEGRRAIGEHFAPNDCYATGPLTGDDFRDLVQCPACSFIAMYDDVIAKAKGGAE